MKIGIVLDGVIIDKCGFQHKQGEIFFNDKKRFINENAYHFRNMFNSSIEEQKKFYKKNKTQYYRYVSSENGASEFTKKLKESGNEIYLLVNRKHIKDRNVNGDINRLLLNKWLKNNNIVYDNILYFDSDDCSLEKYDKIKNLKIDYAIEDQIRDAIILSKACKVILYERPYNLGFSKVKRVSSFVEVIDLLKLKNLKIKDKEMNKIFFKLYYNPRIVNTKFIPKEGPTILCGNHIDVLDFNLVNSACKKKVVWYNQDNIEEVKYQLQSNGVVGIFPERVVNLYRLAQLKIILLEKEIIKINNNKYIRGTECMTEVAQLKAKIENEVNKIDKIKGQLNNMGIKVINHDILLPFDETAIYLSKEYNTPIIPFSITGDYNFLSKNLKIEFGEPYYCSKSLKEDTNIVRNKVKSLIYKNF